jgi:hypothetical protein
VTATRCPGGSAATAARTSRASSAASASSAGPGAGRGQSPARPPCNASHDQLARDRCRSQRRLTFRPMPANHGPNRSAWRSRSRLVMASSTASWAASSASSASPSAPRQTATTIGRCRTTSSASAALLPCRAAATNATCSRAVVLPVLCSNAWWPPPLDAPASVVAGWSLQPPRRSASAMSACSPCTSRWGSPSSGSCCCCSCGCGGRASARPGPPTAPPPPPAATQRGGPLPRLGWTQT